MNTTSNCNQQQLVQTKLPVVLKDDTKIFINNTNPSQEEQLEIKQNEEGQSKIQKLQLLQKQINLDSVFLSQAQKNEYLIQDNQKQNVFTFYCYFQYFSPEDKLKLSYSEDVSKFKNIIPNHLELQKAQYMHRVPQTDIFYIHLILEIEDNISYQYQLERSKNKHNSYIIQRKYDQLKQLNFVIFDTPSKIGKMIVTSHLLLQSYTSFYVQNNFVIQSQFFLLLVKFIQTQVKNKNEHINLFFLSNQDQKFLNVSSLKKIIYASLLHQLQLPKEYQFQINYQISIKDIKDEYDNFLSLQKEIKDLVKLGLEYFIKQEHLIDALTLPDGIRMLIDDKQWNFNFLYLPNVTTIQQINFDRVKQLVKDNLFTSISSIYGISIQQIVQYIEIINPSIDQQIIVIERYFNDIKAMKDQENIQIELINYFLAQSLCTQKKFLNCEKIRKIILKTEKAIQTSLEICIVDNSNLQDQYFKIQENEIFEILFDILNSMQKHCQDVFTKNVINLIKFLNNLSDDKYNLDEYQILIAYFSNMLTLQKNLCEEILKIGFQLKNEILSLLLIKQLDSQLNQMKLELNDASKQLDSIMKSDFSQNLTKKSRKYLVIVIFNTICQQNNLGNVNNYKIIENESFIDMIKIAIKYDAIKDCVSTWNIFLNIKTILEDFHPKKNKQTDLTKPTDINSYSLLNFISQIDYNLEQNVSFEKYRFKLQQYKHMKGFQLFVQFMEDMQIQGYQLIESIEDIYSFEQLDVKILDKLPNFEFLDLLFRLSKIKLALNYILNRLQILKNKNNQPKNVLQLKEYLIVSINELKNHFEQLINYREDNDVLTLEEVCTFWKFSFKEEDESEEQNTSQCIKEFGVQNLEEEYSLQITSFKEEEEYDEHFIYEQIKQLCFFFTQQSKVLSNKLSIPLYDHIGSNVRTVSLYYQNKQIIIQLADTIQFLGFEQYQQFKQNYGEIQELKQILNNLDLQSQNKDLKFSKFISIIETPLSKMMGFLLQQNKKDIVFLIKTVKKLKGLIEYFKELEDSKILLEDLIDVIDDTSMETDVLIQEMMNVSNALQAIREGGEDELELLSCLVIRSKKYQQNVQKNSKLQRTINLCVSNIDLIRVKIQNQSFRSVNTTQIIKNFQNKIIIQIQKYEGNSVSELTFSTENQSSQINETQKLYLKDLELLCQRYQLINTSKKNSKVLFEQIQGIHDSQNDVIYDNLIEVMTLSEEMRLTLDSLRDLGNAQFIKNQYILTNNLADILPQLLNKLEYYKIENSKYKKDLQQAREKYLGLNFYPPCSFKLIEHLKKNNFDKVQSEAILEKLYVLTKFINQREEPNINKLKQYMNEQAINDVGLNLYGKALDSLLQTPNIEQIEQKPQELDRFTKGDQIECRRIKSQDLLMKNILMIFLSHNQKPTSWQIFFCSPKTQIHDLQQFAYLAKNATKSNIYNMQQPLFLICLFESLSLKVQKQFIEELEEMYEERQYNINLLITYIGDPSNNPAYILSQFNYAYEIQSRIKVSELIQLQKIKSFDTISMYTSIYSGFGKTFQINKRGKQEQQQIIEIPIYGETTKLELILLIQRKIQQMRENKYRIHLNLYEPKSIDIHSILFELLVLRRLSLTSEYFVQIPYEVFIDIEIQNTFQRIFESKINYLKGYLQKQNIFEFGLTNIQIDQPFKKIIQGADINLFEIKENPNIQFSDIQVALQYLQSFNQISSFQIPSKEDNTPNYEKNIISQADAIELIKQHFLYRCQQNVSFYHITSILKFFTKQATMFHKAVYLDINQLNYQQIDKSFRQKVFQGIINASVPYSCQIMSNKYDYQESQANNIPLLEALEQRNKNIQFWDDNLGQLDDFFLTIGQSGSLVPIYQNPNSVPKYYRDYLIAIEIQKLRGFQSSEIIKNPIKDWDDLKNIKDEVLINLCTSTRNEKQVREILEKNFNQIAITKTIARKICFLYIKINSDIPTLIMGETGVGKTILVKYLSSLIDSVIFTLNVHAGLSQQEIIKWVQMLIKLNSLESNKLLERISLLENKIRSCHDNDKFQQKKEITSQFLRFRENKNFEKQNYNENKIILFFDEINTNQNTDGLLKELLVDRKIQGQSLPPNFVPIAAANPYKFKILNGESEPSDSLRITRSNLQTSKLVYHVHPLAESMNTFIWNFGELLPQDESKIISYMISNKALQYKAINQFEKTLLQTITGCQEFSRKKQSIMSVSLRDVSRFLKVFIHFLTNPAWQKNLSDSLLLSVFYSYYCRFNNEVMREGLCSYLEEEIKVNNNEGRRSFYGNVRMIINEQMNKISDIINHGESYKSIAFTQTLKENLFMVLISILNSIPIIMVGPPGSSKTLCTRLLYDSMKGTKSNVPFFKNLPNLMYKTYQCSMLSSSESIEKAFKSAQLVSENIKRDQKEQQNECIVSLILDEIGLAEVSNSNPLKVLHRLLEDDKNVPMIGLSNWQLDASKMNRVIFANRPKLSENELIEAAIALKNRISPSLDQQVVINLAKDAFSYFSRINNKIFFHGTRDFYNCVTYVCTQLKDLKEQSEEEAQKIVLLGVLRNFGGSRDISQMLSYFKLSLQPDIQMIYDQNIKNYNPSELIFMNIYDNYCRNLMIIANKPDQALQYAESLCQDRRYKIFQGSDLQDDFTEQNTLKMLNEIITCIEEGYLVIMYRLENLYQSFYDLFNQNYKELGAKHFCRIAIGSDSIRCQVHSNFKIVIIAQAADVYEQVQNYDPPLLNRFEKQYLDLKFLLNENEIKTRNQINQFIQDCSEIKFNKIVAQSRVKWEFNMQDMFPVIQENNKDDILLTLTLKNINFQNENDILIGSQYQLIDLACFSGIVRSHFLKKLDKKFLDYYINLKNHFDFKVLLTNFQEQFEKAKQRKTNKQKADSQSYQDYEGDGELYHQEMVNQSLSQAGYNLIIYTPEYIYMYDKDQQVKNRNFLELEVKGFDNANSLRQEVRQFFNNQAQINLIIIFSIQDSITKILYIKKLLQEERQCFELKNQDEDIFNIQKNLIIVIQLINKQTNFIGLSYDKSWRQIYMENTSSPIHKYDDITNYLLPIRDVLQNDENQIFKQILQECIPKIFATLNFDGANLNGQFLKDRQKMYKDLLENKFIGQELTQFIKNKIIEKIQKECNVYNQINLPCEWYQLVSTFLQQNRDNNTFFSSLKQYLVKQFQSILIRIFYLAEQNNIISSIMFTQIDLKFQENLNIILPLWLQKFDTTSDKEINCDQIKITYPFLRTIRQSIDQFKPTFLDMIKKRFQIDITNQEKINENDDATANRNNEFQNEENQIEDRNMEIQISKLNEVLIGQTSNVNDQDIKYISQINPQIYFDNLHHEVEYQWTQSKILKKIVQKIIECSVKNLSVEIYHTVLWINQNIFTQLSQIWCLFDENSGHTSSIFKKFEQRLEQILRNSQQELQQDVQNIGQQEQKQNDSQDQDEENYYNILQKIWNELLIFTAQLIEVFIIPCDNILQQNLQENRNDYWTTTLRKCLLITFKCCSEYKLYPDEMMSCLSNSSFILKISECFPQNQNIREILKQQIYLEGQFQVISSKNYLKIKENLKILCNQNKKNELDLRIIWQLLKCNDFQGDLLKFEDDVLEDIMSNLSNILNSLDYNEINKKQEESHYFVFTKRILSKIVDKMYEEFENSLDDQYDNDLLDPQYNFRFKKMQKIFARLNIQKNNPICILIIDIIDENEYYTKDLILNYIAKKQESEDNIDISEQRVKKIIKFLVGYTYDKSKGELINVIEFKLLIEICQALCSFVFEAYLNNRQQVLKEEIQKKDIQEKYNKDRKRKSRMIQILNQSLQEIISSDKINPMIPMIVIKIFKTVHQLKNIQDISDQVKIFENPIFLEEINSQDIQFHNYTTFKETLEIIKEQTYQGNQIYQKLDNLTQLKFELTCLITDIILTQNDQEFQQLLSILAEIKLNNQFETMDTQLISHIRDLYINQICKMNENLPLALKKVFVAILVMTTFLNKDSFIQQLYKQEVSIQDIFVPFLVDSNAILDIKVELNNYKAIRRFQCKNCVLEKKKKVMIWNIPPCCMPSKNNKYIQQCQICGKVPQINNHQSPDLEPPTLITGKQEPIFVLSKNNYTQYDSYYTKEYPYKLIVSQIDEFIYNREKVDRGYQSQFSLIFSKKMRNITKIESILIGRVFILSILCLYSHILHMEKGLDYAYEMLENCSLNEIFLQIYAQKGLTYDKSQAWNLLQDVIKCEDQNIMQFFIQKIVKNFQKSQLSEYGSDKNVLLDDNSRIIFEQKFLDLILEGQDISYHLKDVISKKEQKEKNDQIKNIILNGKLDQVSQELEWMKDYKNLCRLPNKPTLNSFINHFMIKPQCKESEFFKKLFSCQNQIQIYNQIYPIQNWVKLFNSKMFDRISKKDSTVIKLQEFIQDNKLENQFQNFKKSWNFFRKQINDGLIQIGIDCAQIELDDIDDKNQKIDIFCYSEDKANRGYPLYLLLNYFKNSHNSFLEGLETDFEQLLIKFSKAKLIVMNEKNFIPPNVFQDNQSNQFFDNYVKEFSCPNPLIEQEREEVYDLTELTCQFIEDNYLGVTKIQETDETDLEIIQLKEFRFIGHQKNVNFIQEIQEKIPQVVYPDAQNNPQQPLLYIDLQNNETCMRLLETLQVAISILLKIANDKKINGNIVLTQFLQDFGINTSGISFEKEKMKLCHLQHVYELAERISFERLLRDVNGLFIVGLEQSQKNVLKKFCDEVGMQDQTIFQDAVGRMVVRNLCHQNVQINPKEGLFKLFQYVSESYQSFWGIEHQEETFQRQINESQWHLKYCIFAESDLENTVITLGQAFSLYRELQIIKQNKIETEAEKASIKVKREQMDLENIQKEQMVCNQFQNFMNQSVMKKKPQGKKDFR